MKIRDSAQRVTASSRVVLAALLIVPGCEQQNQHNPQLQRLEGRTKADAVRQLGVPVRERAVEPGKASDPCRGADRALEYDWPQTGSGTRIRKWLRMRPAQVLYVCVDKSDKILPSVAIEID